MSTSGDEDKARDAFNALLGSLRPKLHRYCARMTGSVIDGEDVVQDALADAIASTPDPAAIANPEGWLFRIAHTTALDYLRKRARREALTSQEDPDMMIDARSDADSRLATSASLRTFMALPASQRSSVILMDVLGYSLEEIGTVTATSVPAVKAALHRGRTRLRKLADEPDAKPLPVLAAAERARLAVYVDRFNARDFDGLRDMLADEVKLDLVARLHYNGRDQVKNYFTQYFTVGRRWLIQSGFVDRRPAILFYLGDDSARRPVHFALLDWTGDQLINIRDFLFAPYAMEGAEVAVSEAD
jgi:RNA polymerase sigma-70 factor (ECF subfamily)